MITSTMIANTMTGIIITGIAINDEEIGLSSHQATICKPETVRRGGARVKGFPAAGRRSRQDRSRRGCIDARSVLQSVAPEYVTSGIKENE